MSSSFGGGGSGQIRYVITVDDSQAIQKLQGVTQQTQQMTGAVENSTTAVKENERSNQSFGSSVAQVGTAVAFAASSVISLVQQYTSLKRAQNTLERAQNIERAQVLAITKQREKYNEAVKKYGKGSKEARQELEKLNIMEAKHGTQVEKIGLLQESLSQRMTSFAFSVVPTVIGVVSGLAQTFQILGRGRSGTGGIAGATLALGKFFLPLALIGGVLLAVKLNLFGIRDAFNSLGKAIGEAVPALKPFLNAVKDIGTVIGIIPGDAEAAQNRLKKLAGGIIEWGKGVLSAISKILGKIKSGDITGAIKDIKIGAKAIVDFISEIKIDGNTIGQWVASLPILLKYKIAQYTSQKGAGGGTKGAIDLLLDFNKMFNLTFTELDPFASWSEKNITTPWHNMVLSVGKFIQDTPIFKGVDILSNRDNQDIVLRPNEAKAWFDKNIVAPIADTYFNVVVPGIANAIQSIPIFKGVDILSPRKDVKLLTPAQAKSWFDAHIVAPIVDTYNNTIVPAIQTALRAITIFGNQLTGKDLLAPRNNPQVLTLADASSWFKTNISDPVITAATNVINTLKDNPYVKAIIGGVGGVIDFIKSLGQTAGGESVGSTLTGISPVDAQKLQTALANLADQGSKSLKMLEVASQKLQTALANLSNEGQKSAQKLQTGIANLSNQGIKSLNALAKASNQQMSGMSKNFKVGESAAQKLQTGIANLSNQGIKALNALAKAFSSSMKSIVSSVQNAQRAVISLIKSIGNLKSKTITITTHFRTTGGGHVATQAAQHGFSGVVTKPTLFLAGESGPEHVQVTPSYRGGASGKGGGSSVVNQTVMLHISGNDIINERNLTKRIKLTVGENRDKFG